MFFMIAFFSFISAQPGVVWLFAAMSLLTVSSLIKLAITRNNPQPDFFFEIGPSETKPGIKIAAQ